MSPDSALHIVSDLEPAGDQPEAIRALVRGYAAEDKKCQTLLGVTGSGKTLTMAHVVEQLGLPDYDAGVLVGDRGLADYFEEVVGKGVEPKAASNWVLGSVLQELGDRGIAVAELREAVGGKQREEQFEREIGLHGLLPLRAEPRRKDRCSRVRRVRLKERRCK